MDYREKIEHQSGVISSHELLESWKKPQIIKVASLGHRVLIPNG